MQLYDILFLDHTRDPYVRSKYDPEYDAKFTECLRDNQGLKPTPILKKCSWEWMLSKCCGL